MARDNKTLREALAKICTLTASFGPGSRSIRFLAELGALPQESLGTNWLLTIGPVTVMGIRIPKYEQSLPYRFGPTELAFDSFLMLTRFDLRLVEEGQSPEIGAPVGGLSGEILEAISLADEGRFFEKIQVHHSRYQDPLVLMVGAKAGFERFSDYRTRAAALTVLSHRLLERDPRSFSEGDRRLVAWICEQGREMVRHGLAAIANPNQAAIPDKWRWAYVRWTVSLASVCAQLSLCRDDLVGARDFYAAAAGQLPNVGLAPVSSLNLVNACLMLGLLLATEGDDIGARQALERGVRAFQDCVAVQDVMANVWVVGDMVNVARASRMCFITLGRLGLLTRGPEPKLNNEVDVLAIDDIQSNVGSILAAGCSPKLLASIRRIANRRITYARG